MKKILSLILALALVMSLSVTAFAATGEGDTPIDVKAQYSTGATTPDVVSVNVEWGAMEFTYSVGGTHNWNADTHTYTDNTTATWTANENTVKVTNHSNVDVKVDFAFAATVNGVTGSFDVTTDTLTKGVENAPDSADSVTTTLTLGGTLPSTQTTMAKVGTITVTIAKA